MKKSTDWCGENKHVRHQAIPKFSRLLSHLENANIFVGPEILERQTGRLFRARVGANESAFGISPRAHNAAITAIEHLSWYGDPENYELRVAIADFHRIDVSQVIVAAGIDDLLSLIIRAFAANDGRAVMAQGSYPTFAYHASTFGVPLDTVSYGVNFHVDLSGLLVQARDSEEVRSRSINLKRVLKNYRDQSPIDSKLNVKDCSSSGSTVVYLANPDNPSGTCHSASAIRHLASNLPVGCVLALDEAYIDYYHSTEASKLVTDSPQVIHLRTFSKAHGMAGARVAYAVCAAEICAGIDKIRLQFGVNRVAQEAARASLSDTEFVRDVANKVASGRKKYYALGQALGIATLPSATNFVCFDLRTRTCAELVMAALLDRGVFVRKPTEPPLDRFIRLSVGSEEEQRIVEHELRHVLEDGSGDQHTN